jgi:hypothetical protein
MKYTKNDITISGIASKEEWFESTLKAVIYSKRISGIPNAQLLSYKEFYHPEVKYVHYPYNINNIAEWNLFMIKYLYLFCPTSFLLNVHNDGFIINPNAWTDEFLDYDYIGALWPIGAHEPIVTEQDRCGNGGFSLRSKRFLEIASLYCPAYPYPNEDRVICGLHRNIFLNNGMVYAPDHIAAQFSIEDTGIPEAIGQNHADRFSLRSFGFHNKNADAIKYLDEITL